MKIIEIVPSLSSGGAERFVVDLSNELSKTNTITLITLKDDTKKAYGFYKKEISQDIKYINLGFNDGKNIKYIWQIYKTIKKEKADVVHIHSVTQYCALAILLLHKKISFYQTVHNDIKQIGNILYYKIAFRLFGKLGWLKFATISRTNFMDMKTFYPKCINTLIYNGRCIQTPTDNFNVVKKEINKYKTTSNTTIFIHVARCSSQKNQELLVRSFNRLIENKMDATLIIIGNGFESEEGNKLKSIACNKIHFLGTRINIIDYLKCSDIFVLSSIYEGMPISLIEAMQAGLAILSTPVCGVIDVVKEKINGVISSNFDDESFYDAMKEIYKNKDKYLSAARTKEFMNNFSIEKTAKQYIEWFKK